MSSVGAIATLCLALTLASESGVAQTRKDIYFGAFFGVDMDKVSAWSSESLIPAAEMALEDVNNDSSILRDYRLLYHWGDSKCDSGAAIRALLKQQESPPHKVAFLGPGCSSASTSLSEALNYWEAIQIGFSMSSPLFSDKEKFPRLFRTATSELMENPARVAILRHFGWRKVAILVENLSIFVMTKENLIEEAEKYNITVIASESFNSDPTNSLKYLQEKDARIIIGLMYEDKFRKAMCSAYRRGYYGWRYVWMIVGWYSHWWTVNDVTCTSEELLLAASNVIQTIPLPLSQNSAPTISKWVPSALNQRYSAAITQKNLTYNMYAAFTYDAVWTLALMLNASIPLLRAHNKSLETLTYHDHIGAKIFTDILQKTDFHGMSGRVTFDFNGDRETQVQIAQVKGTARRVVGIFDVRESSLNITPGGFQWASNHPPYDGVTKIRSEFSTDGLDCVMFVVLVIAGLLFCAFCLLFNYYNRTNRYIKISSPRFNNVTVIGCCVWYIDVLLSTCSTYTSIKEHRLYCIARSWLLPTGFTLAFGAMFAKTYRVYRIFTNNELKKELGPISNRCLALRLFVYWMGNAILLVAWQLIDPLYSIEVLAQEKESSSNNHDTIHLIYSHECHSTYYQRWVISLLTYQGALLVFGMFLSFETRHVHIEGLNDSRSIGIAVYNVFMFSSLAVCIEYFVTDKQRRLLFGRLIIFGCTTFTIALLFLPKIIYLRKNRRVSNDFTTNDKNSSSSSKSNTSGKRSILVGPMQSKE
ncbi:gamma-aminobutyric acid type B receptor subunit 1 isoform X2 [Nematostella vectensis]|uniref:gamma-aminobutyric acid type B receptor subunit 1 isoform X1 n=1 Tax=Nematostella vectensis TaxID=45351 RepID=UPI0020775CB3|nr:gamma-aminobutyric acid type B receptor subunit 1 isoform X1 [Nematostella vectensis]XP_048577558.1 gamma-aminobutyric acid type B receptor subunit 1 isoform X1 [Nematostella vectensis]XP_048577559.1 gamma-aminobutyric acid type B receptor subunit 1 isoform X2 [Nematostella vectensis]